MARLRNSLLKLIVILGLLVAAGYIWRDVVVETVMRLALSSRGLGDARFEVAAVGRNEIVVENISLGAGLLSAQRMRLSYDPEDVVSGRLRDLRVEGLKLDNRAARDGTLEQLQALASGDDEPWIELPKILLENAVIMLADPADGTISINGELNLSDAGLGAVLDIGIDLGHTTAAFAARSEVLGQGGVISIRGRGESELAGIPLLELSGTAATGGRARFTVEGTARIPAIDATSPGSWLVEALSLKGDLLLSEVTTSIQPAVLSADIGWVLSGGNDGLRIDLARPARLVAQKIGPGILAALRLPSVDGAAQDLSVELSSSGPIIAWSPKDGGGTAEFAGEFAVLLGDAVANVRATAKVEHDSTWRLSSPAEIAFRAGTTAIPFAGPEGSALLREAEWAATGSLTSDGQVDLNGVLAAEASDIDLANFKADAATVNGNIRVRRAPGRWSIAIVPGLTIAMEGVAVPDQLRIDEPVLLSVDRLDISGVSEVTQLDISASSDQLSGVLLGGDDQDVAFTDAGGRVMLALSLGGQTKGEIRIEDAHVVLPREAIGLNTVFGTLPFGADRDPAQINLSAEMRDTSRNARFGSVRIDLEGERDGDNLSVTGILETLDRTVRLPMKGSANLAEMTGGVKLGPTRLTFSKGGLQPGALNPNLAALRNVAGVVLASAAFDLGADGAVRSGTKLVFKDVSARVGEVDVIGLSGTVRFNRLPLLATMGAQKLTARRLIAGVPVDNPRLRFTIMPKRRGISVRLHEVTGDIAGGEITLKDARWDSAAKTNAFDVQVRDVDIDRLLRDWQVEGISGTGRLSGMIPVRIGPSGIAVVGGQIDSTSAGAIRVDWGAARKTMVKSGKQVALMVKALENFSYDTLSIGIDQPENGELTLAIGLEGANSSVLDGYPFRFNINLSGKLAPILDAVREGRRIGAGLIQGGLGLP